MTSPRGRDTSCRAPARLVRMHVIVFTSAPFACRTSPQILAQHQFVTLTHSFAHQAGRFGERAAHRDSKKRAFPACVRNSLTTKDFSWTDAFDS